jgi:putative ABC transport system permease protein
MLSFADITRELFAEKTRTILTILAIAWGTFAIASMLAVGEGLRLTFAQTVANTGKNLLVLEGGKTLKTYHGAHPNIRIRLNKKDLDTISTLPNINTISPQYDLTAIIKYQDQEQAVEIQATQSSFARIHQIDIAPNGRFINYNDLKDRHMVIVLGTKTLEYLFPHTSNPIGKYVFVNNRPFLVIGAMQAKPQIIAQEAPDADYNWIPSSTYELLNNPEEIDSISITYKDPLLLEETKQQIRSIIALNHGLNAQDQSIVNFSDLAKQQKTINTFFLGMQIFLGIIGILNLLVAAVGITNVMYASVNRATREIGIRMAIGARSPQILFHYIAEALIATFFGGVIGIFMSLIFVYGLRAIPLHGQLIETIGKPEPILSFLVITIVISVLGIMGFLAGLFPALKATKVDPAEALIYE